MTFASIFKDFEICDQRMFEIIKPNYLRMLLFNYRNRKTQLIYKHHKFALA